MTALSSPHSLSRAAAALSRMASRIGRPLLALSAVAAVVVPAAQAQNLFTFPAAVAVGQSSSPQTVTVSLSTTGTAVSSVQVLTMGVSGLDFTKSGSDSCAGITSGSCTVNVVFSPKFPGIRSGAVVLLDASNNPLGTEYLSGTGQGGLGVMIPGAISTIAGQTGKWTQINDGSPATQADLYLPSGLAIDGNGDLFIADSNHNRIREVLAVAKGSLNPGTIITVAGDGNPGYDSAATVATATSLNLPGGVAVDGAGNLYIADTNNNVIRRVNLITGSIATVAGTGLPGYTNDGAAATSAKLNAPAGVTVDAAGNLYIADTGNNAIRKVDAVSGNISTVVGDGSGQPGYSGDGALATAAKLNAPYQVAFDAAGNMYIPDSANNVIRRVDVSQHISTYAGNGTEGYSGDGAAAASAELYSPHGIACDPAGNVYIADARNYVIRKVAAVTGTISTVAGNNNQNYFADGKGVNYGNGLWGGNYSGDGIATIAGIYAPYAVLVDPAGNLVVAEYFDNLVREVSANTATLFFSPAFWLNQTSAPEAQTIENDGNAALTLTAITPDANASYDAGKTTCTTTGTVAIDDHCIVDAEFVPSTSGSPLVANVNVSSSQPNSPLDIQLVGQALAQNQVNVTLTNTPNPSAFGASVTLSINVAKSPTSTQGMPTGTVTFNDTFQGTTTTIGTPQTLDSKGNAALFISSLAVGSHTITADYSGDTYYAKATSNPVTQAVQEQVTVSITGSSPNNTSTLGSAVTFTAAVTVSGGIPVTGAVSFYDGATFLGSGSVNGSGLAAFATSSLPVGSNSITATYTDVNNVSATSSPLVQTVEQLTATSVTSSANPSIHGSSVTFTATVLATGTATPIGQVTFYDGTTQLGTRSLTATGATSGVASLQISTLTAGTHSITASYSGDTNDFSSTSAALTQTVQNATTTASLTASANPAIAGRTLTLTATVTSNGGVAAGTVSFYNGASLLGSATLNGSGIATWSSSRLPVGTYALTASYAGDSNDNASTSPIVPLSIIQATTAVQLSASGASILVTNPVTFTAKVSGNGGVPTGTVTFMDGGNTLGSVALNSSGVAAYTTSSLALGAHTITAQYLGDANDAASTSAQASVAITAYVTQTNLASSASSLNTDQELTLLTTTSSTGAQAPTGTITFMNGTASLGSATVGSGGAATLTINPAVGTYSITARYSGDAFNAPSTSNAVSITVSQATEFTVQLNPTSVTIPTSKYANIGISLASQNSFSDTLSLGCASLPAEVTCNFAQNNINLSANGKASVQLTVDTANPLLSGGQAKNETPGTHGGMLAACVFPGAALFGFAFWRFRKNAGLLKMLAIVAVLAGTTLAMTGCGGVSINSAPAGSYVIQVTATGQKTGIVHIANLTVQVTK
jgi:sugar lactone lactonase YvrE